MLCRRIRRILSVAFGISILCVVVGLYTELDHTKKVNTELTQKIQVMENDKVQFENEILTLNKTVDSLKRMEFKFIYPAGMEFDLSTEIKEGENGYYAEVKINGLSANAGMVTNFKINGSQYDLSLTEFDLLARTVRAESGGMSEQANIATANVVLHRVDSSLYPNNLYDVIHQPHQFEVVDRGTYYKQPTDKAISATVQALNGVDVVPNALGFWNAELVPAGHELWQYPIAYKIDDHVFSRLDS